MTDLASADLVKPGPAVSAAVGYAGVPAGGSVRDFIVLMKPRVMSLVVFSGIAGLTLAPGHIHPFLAAVAVLAIALGAGASGAINMWYDRDIDAVMRRTSTRPLPDGRMEPGEALGFGVVLAVFSVMLMGLAVNWVAATILAVTILFYVFVYTAWLKRRTPQNIVIGGAAGAFPPMIGWAAVTGDVGLGAVVLFLLIFFWTPPHFWALSLFRTGDYAKAGVPMMPVVAGARETKKQMLLYTVVLWPVGVAPFFLGLAGVLYLAAALIVGTLFIHYAIRVWREEEGDVAAKKMFGFSILYLFILLAVMILDRAPGLLGNGLVDPRLLGGGSLPGLW